MKYDYLRGVQAPTFFYLFGESPGFANLSPFWTLNGITKSPILRYSGIDAANPSWPCWDYGETLAIQLGTPPTFDWGSPFPGVKDGAVLFNGDSWYKSSTPGLGDVSTLDFVIEMLIYFDDTAYGYWLSQRNNGIDEGWSVYTSNSSTLQLYIEMTGGGYTTVDTDTLVNKTLYHVVYAVNRDQNSIGGAQAYVWGVASGAGKNLSAFSDISSNDYFTMGGRVDGARKLDDAAILYAAVYIQADWLQAGPAGQAEVAAVASERSAQLLGVYPSIAAGTAMPTTISRDSVSYLDKMEGSYRRLYFMGENALRVCSRNDLAAVEVQGYLPESEAENLIVESEDFGTTWALLDGGDGMNTDATICPDKRSVGDGIIGDATDGQHGFSIAPTLTADTYALSVFGSPGNKDWIKLEDSTVANCTCYFDVANGTVGTAGAGATGYIEGPFSGDAGTTAWYRCCIVFTGTAAAHTLKIMAAHADNDDDFSGDGGTTNAYFWGAQCELGDYMTSPIRTAGGTSTRLADQLTFVAGANIGGEDVGRGTIICDVLLPNITTSIDRHLYKISDGGAATDQILSQIRSGGGAFRGITAKSAGNAGQVDVAVNVADGYRHTIRIDWATDNLIGRVDSSSNTDATADMPVGLDEFVIGDNSGSEYLNGLISKLHTFV